MRTKIFIMGHSNSGKSTIAKALSEELGIERIRTYTSRPRREGEGDDDYIFVTPQKFQYLEREGRLTGVRHFNTYIEEIQAVHSYGLPIYGGLKSKGVIILDVKGYLEVVDTEHVGRDKAIAFFLDVDEDLLVERAKSRGDFKPKEWERRFAADSDTMNGSYIDELNMTFKLHPHVIYKVDGSLDVDTIVEQIVQVLREHDVLHAIGYM